MKRIKRRRRIIRAVALACLFCGLLGTRTVLNGIYLFLAPQTPPQYLIAGGLLLIAAGYWCLVQVLGALFLYDLLFQKWVRPLIRPVELRLHFDDEQLRQGITTREKATREFIDKLKLHRQSEED